jgi:hypothetical protein
MLRRQLLEHLAEQYRDRPDLLEKVTPTYIAGAKRMLRDNGVRAAALHQPHVHLVTEGIGEITRRASGPSTASSTSSTSWPTRRASKPRSPSPP